MTICFSVCLSAGLRKYYWLELHGKKSHQKMGQLEPVKF